MLCDICTAMVDKSDGQTVIRISSVLLYVSNMAVRKSCLEFVVLGKVWLVRLMLEPDHVELMALAVFS